MVQVAAESGSGSAAVSVVVAAGLVAVVVLTGTERERRTGVMTVRMCAGGLWRVVVTLGACTCLQCCVVGPPWCCYVLSHWYRAATRFCAVSHNCTAACCSCVVSFHLCSGFARPQPRPHQPSSPHQQQQTGRPQQQPLYPLRPHQHQQPPHRGLQQQQQQQVQLADAAQADGVLAGVRARQAPLVEQQLSHLILTQALASEEVWGKACKVCWV